MRLEIDKRDLARLEKAVLKAADKAMLDTSEYYKKITPVKSGFAKRNTTFSRSKNQITANYGYADKLDSGASKQAPRGMGKPSVAFLEKQLQKNFDRI